MQQLGIHRPSIRMDSLGKFVLLAAGAGEIFCRLPTPSRPDYRESIWDIAAGALLTTEAGGTVTDLEGKALDFSQGRKLLANRGTVATNGAVHRAFLEAARAA